MAVAAGGVAGAALRWAIVEAIPAADFPWGVLVVNIAGCALLGFIGRALLAAESDGQRRLALGAGAGFCGALTTFSAFAVDLAQFWNAEAWGRGLLYLALSVGFGALAVWAGAHAFGRT